MQKYVLKLCFIFMFVVLIASCAIKNPQFTFEPYDLNSRKEYVQKIDNFLVVTDASYSMTEAYNGQEKFYTAKNVLSAMNQTIPEINIKAGIRSFGHSPTVSKESTTLMYGMTNYSKKCFENGLNKLKRAGGTSPMSGALDAASDDLKSLKGNIALLIVSDAKEIDKSAATAAKNLKQQFGDRICIYTVLVGNDMSGKELMESIASIGECGLAVNADQILSSQGMADFVTKIFLKKLDDTDGDGVYDPFDKCPNTPTGVAVDQDGCPLDSDGDGVYDYMDECPDTPKGAPVNSTGCWLIGNVFFDFDKEDIKESFYSQLDGVIEIIKKNQGLKIRIDGHTDSIGTAEYNQGLSLRRANAVYQYLISQGLDQDQFVVNGYGLTRPVATNDTEDGRAQNRRVELSIAR